jgi:hypothetical protein
MPPSKSHYGKGAEVDNTQLEERVLRSRRQVAVPFPKRFRGGGSLYHYFATMGLIPDNSNPFYSYHHDLKNEEHSNTQMQGDI